MIEELTPQLLTLAFRLVIGFSSVLTLIASVLVLWLYRRSVLRAMQASADARAQAGRETREDAVAAGPARADAAQRYRRALNGPWRVVWRCTVAGGLFAVVVALAFCVALPEMLTPSRIALMVWAAAWPVVLATALTGPSGTGVKAVAVAAYFSPLILVTLFDLLSDAAPTPMFGGDLVALRAVITPLDAARSWVQGNALPTLLFLLFLNRRVRAVGPLLLGFITMITTGCLVLLLGMATQRGADLLAWLIAASSVPRPWWAYGSLVAALVVSGVAGWAMLRVIRDGYVRKTLNDRSLTLDALWLLFASWYAMWLAQSGLAWVLAAPLAFCVYKLAWFALWAVAPLPNEVGRGLVFLRVFSLGRRSDRLFDALSRHWRHVGSLQLITGPDVAQSTVQPHQLLDFLSGRLARNFVADAASLALLMAQRDTRPDRDGWFRVNSFFCHADTWREVLAGLVRDGDAVLMDLRSFSARNAGCVHELHHLVNFVPLGRCVLLIDASTDELFVRQTLREAWRTLDPRSPNRGIAPEAVPLHAFESGRPALRRLLQQLCAAA